MVFCSQRRLVSPDSPCEMSISAGGTRRGSFQFEMCSGRDQQLRLTCEQAEDMDGKERPDHVSSVSHICAAHGQSSDTPTRVTVRSRTPSEDEFCTSLLSERVVINCICSTCRMHRCGGDNKATAGQDECRTKRLTRASFKEAMMNTIVDFNALPKGSGRSPGGKRLRSRSFLAAVREESLAKGLSKARQWLNGKRAQTHNDVGEGRTWALEVPQASSGLSASTHDLSRPCGDEWLCVGELDKAKKSHSWHGQSVKDRPREISYHSHDWQTTGFAFLVPVHAFTAPAEHAHAQHIAGILV